MVLSKSLIVIKFCLLVYSTKGEVYRENELLYARVASGAEFVFIPHQRIEVATIAASRRLALTKHKKVFRQKARSRGHDGERADVEAYDFVPYNWLGSGNQRVTRARILRLKEGRTTGYLARVGGGRCFYDIKLSEPTFSGRRVTQDVMDELTEACIQGFTALKPSPGLSKLNGTYTGSRLDRSLEVRFSGGVVEDVDLLTEKPVREARLVTYHPLCNGMISLVGGGTGEPEGTVALMILKKSRGEEETTLGRWLLSWVIHDEEPLCNAEKHGRRNITRSTLFKWDHILPLDYNLIPKAKMD
ncbi:hypothetical protein FOZ62_028738 [Perkinsus olseni]|uniref:Uncharacterized protein n=1 Tax=Perkinsus olseni TaxID=32597 RepID=A0A7J6T3B3_PEROL|nr:hypothetical protein FOZ62_028738 [Perkinsus olseni]